MLHSVRFVIRGKNQGRSRHNFNMPNFEGGSEKSVIFITVGEVKFGTVQMQQTDPRQNFHYHLGDASVWVTSICPHKNEFAGESFGVEFHLHSDFPGPIDVGVTISVEDNLPLDIQGF
jgi:hypothetical protein